jgi:hypothetical protein
MASFMVLGFVAFVFKFLERRNVSKIKFKYVFSLISLKVEENGKPERFYGSKSACPTQAV